MIGKNKKFDKNLHSTHDPKSRRLIKKFFSERGIKLIDHPNKFDIDLITEDGLLKIEIEHRMSWDTHDFPYSEVNVPERKLKFFKESNVHYIILSKNYTRIGFIESDRLKKYMKPKFLKESPNRFVEEEEYFYKIPVGEFEWYDIK